MPMDITDPEARILYYCAAFFECLESVGYGHFRDKNPKLTVKLLIKRLSPKPLKHEMIKRVKYDESLEKSVKSFVTILVREAINCHTYAVQEKDSDDSQSHGKLRMHEKQTSKNRTSATAKSPKAPKDKEAPLYLWEEHRKKGIIHLLRNFRDCHKDEKDRLFLALRAEKNETGSNEAGSSAKRTANKTESPDTPPSSVRFKVTFDGKWQTSLCADNCADANLIDQH